MNKIFSVIKQKIRKKLYKIIKPELNRKISEIYQIIPQLIDYYNAPPKKKHTFYQKEEFRNFDYFNKLKQRLISSGVIIEDISINISDFKKWLKNHPEISAMYRNMGDVYIEKALEHYLSYTYLEMSQKDVFIDIAASGSPFSDILRKYDKIKSYRLDLSYKSGIHKNDIGADAGKTNLPYNFANALALHCSYECFEGNSDIDFISEASRILKDNGRYIILPLYVEEKYYISSSPYCNQEEIIIDDGAVKIWRDDQWKIPFARHYSPEIFYNRIFSKIPDNMRGKVLFIKNLPELKTQYKGQRIYCWFMFFCKKK